MKMHRIALGLPLALLAVFPVHAQPAWTVDHSIAIETIDTGDDAFLYSPDKRRVAFVLRKGLPGTYQSRASLLVYDVAALQHFAVSPGPPPAPLLAVDGEAGDNLTAIRHLRWGADNTLLYVASEADGITVYSWRPGGSAVREGRFREQVLDVMPIGDGRRLLVLTALEPAGVDDRIPRLANGHTFETVVGIETFSHDYGRPAQLNLLDRASHEVRTFEPMVLGGFGLWPSPDGRHVAAFAPHPTRIEGNCWKPGERVTPGMEVHRSGFDQATYLLLDLETGKALQPLAAPTGFAVPGFQATMVGQEGLAGFVWSADSSLALATFSLDSSNRCGGAGGDLVPAAYAIDMRTMNVSRLQPFPVIDPAAPSHYYSIVADVSGDGKRLRLAATTDFSRDGKGAIGASYRRQGEQWVRTGDWAPVPQTAALPTTALLVDEDLNRPPILAAVGARGQQRPLRNLAPSDTDLAAVDTSHFRWQDAYGREWSGVLALPAQRGPAPLPLILQTHGYPKGAFFSTGAETTTCFPGRAAVSRGFAVLTVDETAGLGKDFDDSAQEGATVADGYASGVQALVKDGIVDANRVAGIGWSRSGWWIEVAINRYPKLFRAASICDHADYGYMQYLAAAAASPETAHSFEVKYGGSPWAEPQRWLAESPPFNLAKARVPVRFEADSQLLYALYMWEGFQALRLNQVPSELWVLPGGTHSLVRPMDQRFSQQGTLDWIDYWLNGTLEEDPSDPDRANRWSDMRRAFAASSGGGTGTFPLDTPR